MTNRERLARQPIVYLGRPRVRLDAVLVIDVEATTYGDQPRNTTRDVIQIGACELSLADGSTRNADSVYVRPTSSEVTPFCAKLTGITPQTAAAGLPYVDACTWLQERFSSHSLPWASFGDFDRAQFVVQCGREGVEYPLRSGHIDIMVLAALRFGWSRQKGLARSLAALDLKFEGTPHDARYDALNAARVLYKVLRP